MPPKIQSWLILWPDGWAYCACTHWHNARSLHRAPDFSTICLPAISVAASQSLWAQHSQSALSVADIPRLLRVGSQRGDVHGIGTWWKHRFSATCVMSRAFTHSTHCPGFLIGAQPEQDGGEI